MSVNAMEPKRVHIVTMGCQMNVYDSEQMERMLAPLNYRPTSRLDEADLILLNTCSIREKAQHKVHSYLGRLSRVKERRPDLIIGVGGCVAQQEGRRLLQKAPHVDIVFGTFALRRLPDLLKQVAAEKSRIVDVDRTDTEWSSWVKPPVLQDDRSTAFVTIMRGCDNFCTYCIVPYVRGREVSRKPDSILQEIRHLVGQGIREVTLLGQNVNSYGMKEGNGFDFPALLEATNNIEGLKRIRFTTSHPKDLSDRLIGAFGRLEKLAPHIHLPVQSGSDRILKRMNRGYTRSYCLSRIERLREVQPDMAITSDIIVGFPGEEEANFQQTSDLVASVGFDNLYSFKYSDRPYTRARRFGSKVEEAVKRERLSELLELQGKITSEKYRSLVGTVQEVLVEGASKKRVDQMTGRTPCDKVVNFSDKTARAGQIVPINIVEALSHSLLGRPVKSVRQDSGKKGGMMHAA